MSREEFNLCRFLHFALSFSPLWSNIPLSYMFCMCVVTRIKTVGVVLYWMIRFIAPYTFTEFGITDNYSAITILQTLQFTVPQALWFSVFTSRIMATDLSQSHCNFNSHMKSSCHSLIPFLPFLLNHLRLPSPELDPILIPAAWDPRYIASGRTPRKTPSTIVTERVYSSVA
jgi:hypothetical protein